MDILDMKCAEYGSKIASAANNDEMLITKALGVLQEDGVYAFFLYLYSLNRDASGDIATKSSKFLEQNAILGHISETQTDVLISIRDDLSHSLNKLLFAKELLERTLVYARYHAKAAAGNQKAKENKNEARP